MPASIARGFGNYCGDGTVAESEECDDGNYDNRDGCSANCKIETDTCGNGIVEEGEECDDGNGWNGDGCNRSCEIDKKASSTTSISKSVSRDYPDYYERFVDILAEHTSSCHLGSEDFSFAPITEFSPGANKKVINLLKTACVIDGYQRNGVIGFHGDAPLGVAEALKILTQLYEMRGGSISSQFTTMPYSDISSSAWYRRYVVDALNQGLLDGITQSELKPLTPIKPIMLQQIVENIDADIDINTTQQYILRNTFVDIVYEIFRDELEKYAYINGRNMIILSRIHGNISQLEPAQQYEFLTKLKSGLAKLDADDMMNEHLIDITALVSLIEQVL